MSAFAITSLFEYKDLKDKILKISSVVIILLLIGFTRTVLEVSLGVTLDLKWYSLDPDLIFSVTVFPFYVCFFLFMCLHIIFRILKIDKPIKSLIALLFFLQFLHVLVPVGDHIGIYYNVPWNIKPYLNPQNMMCNFSLNYFYGMQSIYQLPIYFTPLLLFYTKVTSLGINGCWMAAMLSLIIFLRKAPKVSVLKIILVILLVFPFVYCPIYKYYFVFDGLFNKIAGINYYNHYGYGSFFLIFGTIGLIYYSLITRNIRKAS